MTLPQKPRLLVADDDRSVLAAYRLVLEKIDDGGTVENLFGLGSLEAELFGEVSPAQHHWRVTFVEQGIDAVNAVKWALDDGDPYAAIFLDVRMPPGIDGYESARRIRALDPHVHIIVVSGYSDYTLEDFLKVAGPEHLFSFMPKPLWPEQLRKVARILSGESNHRVQLSPHRLTKALDGAQTEAPSDPFLR